MQNNALQHKKIAVTRMIAPMSLVRYYGEMMINRVKLGHLLKEGVTGLQAFSCRN